MHPTKGKHTPITKQARNHSASTAKNRKAATQGRGKETKMFYLKKFGFRLYIESDNVYTTCPVCHKEHRVDISEVFSDGQSDLYGTAIFCPICSAKHAESLKRTGGAS